MKPKQKGAKDFPSTELYRTICVSETNQKTNTESNLALSVKQTNAKIVSGLRLTFIKRSGNSVT